ncbi:hypothetical protein LCGC14_2589950 [marine sediment metagenome]|uniref:Uncharacterized protein n=1 Tax=marine sediment metagenome TaxID=412755 RepID=A0A0F9D4P3_9ZZZZ
MSYFDTGRFNEDVTHFFRLLDRIATALEKLVKEDEGEEVNKCVL